jgi:hypothetical protein
MIVLTNKNKLYSQGVHNNGQTGQNRSETNVGSLMTKMIIDDTNPLNSGEHFVDVFASRFTTIALTNQGRLFGCGYNNYGEFGRTERGSNNLTLKLATDLDTILDTNDEIDEVYMNYFATIIKTKNNKYYSSGRGDANRQYNLTTSTVYQFTELTSGNGLFGNSHINSLQSGNNFFSVVTENNRLWTWGFNTGVRGLGQGSTNNSYVEFPPAKPDYYEDGTLVEITDAGFAANQHESRNIDYLNNTLLTSYSFIPEIPIDYEVDFNLSTDADGNSVLHLAPQYDYVSGSKIALTTGIYKITNISSDYPLALINSDVSSSITYDGTTLSSTSTGPDENEYSFYTGTMYIYVETPFTANISFYTTNGDGSYLGTQDAVFFQADMDIYLNKLDTSTTFTSKDEIGFENKLDITYRDLFASLQTEYIVTTNNSTATTWESSYVKSGSAGSTSLTKSGDNLTYGSDSTGNYYIIDGDGDGAYLSNYPNVSYLNDVDTANSDGLTFEIWTYYDGTDGTGVENTNGVLIGKQTDHGPFISLNDTTVGGIGTSPGGNAASGYGGDTYAKRDRFTGELVSEETTLTNPGLITDSSNEGVLLHIVGYWKYNSTEDCFDRGVYINGTHYPQLNTKIVLNQSKPGFNDNINTYFAIGAKYGSTGGTSGTETCGGVRVYGFRIWHTVLDAGFVNSLYSIGANSSVFNPPQKIPMPLAINLNPISSPSSSIIYTNKQHHIGKNAIYSIKNDSNRYAIYIDDSNNQLSFSSANSTSIDVSGVNYYTGEIGIKLKGDVSMNIDLNIYDKQTSLITTLYSFIEFKTESAGSLVDNTSLQFEYLAHPAYANDVSWNSIFEHSGDVGGLLRYSTSTTPDENFSDNDQILYETDDNGIGYYNITQQQSAFSPSYANKNYLNNLDTTTNAAVTMELWFKAGGTLSSNQPLRLIGIGNTNEGLSVYYNSNSLFYLAPSPDRLGGATNTVINDYSSSSNLPGSTMPENVYIHMVAQWKRKDNDGFFRSVWRDGVNYPVKDSDYNGSNRNYPTLDGFSNSFYGGRMYVGAPANMHLYGIRLWHRDLDDTEVKNLYDGGIAYSTYLNLDLRRPTNVLPFLLDENNSYSFKGFNVIDLSGNAGNNDYEYKQEQLILSNNQLYRILVPSGKSFAIVGSKDQTGIQYNGLVNDGTVDISGSSYTLYAGMVYLYLTDDFSNNSLTIYDETGYDYNTFNKLHHNYLLSDQLTTNMEFSDTSNNIILDKENTNYLNFKEINTDPRFKQSFIVNWTPGNSQDLKFVMRNPNMKISLPYTNNTTSHRNYSITLSSLILCNSEQAGKWHFGFRTRHHNWCSAYILKGNYSWFSDHTYNDETIDIRGYSRDSSNRSHRVDRVFDLSASDFISYVDENHPNADITKLVEITKVDSTQHNASFTFEEGEFYSFLLFWRGIDHRTTNNLALNFGFWKDGDTEVTLQAGGVTTGGKGNFNDIYGFAVPDFFYNYYDKTYDNPHNIGRSIGLVPYSIKNLSFPININSNSYIKVEKGISYSIDIPPDYPITVINNGYTDYLDITGESNYSTTQAVSGVNYTFYYGPVKLNIYKNFYDISGGPNDFVLYTTYKNGNMVGIRLIMDDLPDILPLEQKSKVGIDTRISSSPKYTFNSRSFVLDQTNNDQFGYYKGTYILTDIPEEYSMAILNNGHEDKIEYYGIDTKGTYSAPDGNTYTYYYNTITILVKSNDLTLDDASNTPIKLSIASYNNGYMGGEDIFVPEIQSSSDTTSNIIPVRYMWIKGSSTSVNYMNIGTPQVWTKTIDILKVSGRSAIFTKDDITVRNNYSRSGSTSNPYKASDLFNTSATSYIATWRNDGYNHVLVTFDKVYDLNDILNIVIDTRSGSYANSCIGIELLDPSYNVVASKINTSPSYGSYVKYLNFRGINFNDDTPLPFPSSPRYGQNYGFHYDYTVSNIISAVNYIDLSGDYVNQTSSSSISYNVNKLDLLHSSLHGNPIVNVDDNVKGNFYNVSRGSLQFEYIAHTDYATENSWLTTYSIGDDGNPEGVNTTATDFGVDPTTPHSSPYYIQVSDEADGFLPHYNNRTYVAGGGSTNFGTSGNYSVTYEVWFKYDGNPNIGIGQLMGIETSDTRFRREGPFIELNKGGGRPIGASPMNLPDDAEYTAHDGSSSGGTSYQETNPNPGTLLDDYKNKMIHGVFNWSKGRRTIYINGREYYLISSNYPDFINQANDRVRLFKKNQNNSIGVKVYAIRLWHRTLSALEVSRLYYNGINYSSGLQKNILSNYVNNELVLNSDKVDYYFECLQNNNTATLINDPSFNDVMVLNGDTSYDNTKLYAVYDGTYKITNVLPGNAFTILNHNVSDKLTFTGTTLEASKASVYNPSDTYNYYSGDITITITGEFENVLLLEHIDASLNLSLVKAELDVDNSYQGFCRLIYHDLCNPYNYGIVPEEEGDESSEPVEENPINSVCLDTTSTIKVSLQTVTSSKYILNYSSGKTYDSTLHYGVNVGNYRITNIPDDYPLAIFNSAVTNEIIYTGTNLVGSKYDVKAGGTYDFYSGTIYLTVKSIPTNINALSFGAMNDATLFEENKLIFDTDCVSDGSYSLCLPPTNTLAISSNKVLINNESFVNGKLAGVHDGYYKFTDVSSTYPIAFASDASNSYSYTGISYKSVEHDILIQSFIDVSGVSQSIIDVSYQNVNFFYGDVELYVKGSFDELSLYVYNGGSFIRQKLNYTDFCSEQGNSETTAKTVQCLKQDSSMNIVYDNGYKVLFNDLTTYDDRIMYGLFYGSYTVRDVPPEYAFRLIGEYDYGVDPSNIDLSNVYITSDSYILKNISDPIEDYSGVYYYGDVNIVIKDNLSYLNKDIKVQFVDMSVPDDLFVFTDTCASENSYYTKCLDISNSINIVNNDGNKYVFNGDTEYEEYLKLGVFIGEYEIHNIPDDHPIAILNHDVSDAITYTGDNLYGVKQVNDVSYNFYTGTIVINVKDDFTNNYGNGNNNLSFYCYNHGYMGSENVLVFTDVCYDPSYTPYFVECLDTSTNITIDGSNILLNNDTRTYYYKRYGITVGTYNFNDVSENTPITFISSVETNQYDVDGTLYGVKAINDVSYSFYYGDVKLKIYEDFSNNGGTNLSLYEYNSESYYGMENKLVFDNTCGDLGETDFSYVICLKTETIVNTYLVDSSYFYTFNDSTDYFGYKRFGMHVGNFILKNIPIVSPIALLNKDISDNIIYSGDSNKKFTKQGPDGHTYDFYYGDVDVKVFGDFGTMSAYSYQGHYAGTEDLFQFTDYCEVNGFVTQCMSLDTSFNKYNNKFTMNNSSSYNEFIRYGLTTGTYTISNIPSDEAIGFITNDISNSVVIYGNSEDLCGNFAGPDGNNYDFYTNKINIIVKNKFDGFLKMYSYADLSYNNGEELLTYSDLCTEINTDQKFIRCLDNEKTLDISSVDGSFVVLDTSYNYNTNRQYGMFNGVYTFNVPEAYPIAFFNAGKETKIIYKGSSSKRTLKADPTGTNLYYYYHGTVTVSVMDDFGTLSYHILNNGYMGGENNLVYTDKCELNNVPYVVECLTNTSEINIFDDNGVNKYSLNSNSHSNDFVKFGVHDGNYTITDICNNYPIALLNNGKEEHIHYSGASTDLCGNFTAPDGNNYNFYKNSINITVNSDFTSDISGMSLYVYGDISGYYGLEEKLLYTDICEDTLTTERVVTNTDITLLKFNKLKYNTYKKAGNNSYFI